MWFCFMWMLALLAPLLSSACVIGRDARKNDSNTLRNASERKEKITWYSSGNVKQRWFIREVAPGKYAKDGMFESWHEDGSVWARGNYINDEKDGLWSVHEIGGDRAVHHWSKGLREGLWEWWRSSGERKAIESYVGGKRHGLFAQWFENGSLYYCGTYDNDEKEGPWVEFLENGKMRKLELFHKGEQIKAGQ